MQELLKGLLSLSYWDKLADTHGFLAMLLLVLFGTALALYPLLTRAAQAARWMRYTLYLLFADITLVNLFGLYIYGAYRAAGGPRTFLKASVETSWLHTIVFEHKEMLAYAAWVIVLVALAIVAGAKEKIALQEYAGARRVLLFCLTSALIFVLVIAGEAVLVTKVAPLR